MGLENNILTRARIFIRRWMTAKKLGVFFSGTTNFRVPFSLLLNSHKKKLTIPAEQSGIHWDFINLFFDDEYGLESIEPKPRLIYDVGGNVGLFSILCRLNFPNAKVKSFEPHPETFRFLAANGREFAFECFNFAVGSQNGDAFISSLDESRANCVSASLTNAGVQISVKSLRDMILRESSQIDLLKLDCEGGEWDIFQDAEPFQRVDEIRMEYHLVDSKSLEDLRKAADRIGFEIVKLVPNSGFGIAWMTRKGA
jgi:FkbM family methyltransferase